MKRKAGELTDVFSSLRFSGFTVLIVALVIGGAVIVSPNLATFVQQQREIAELRESVRVHRENVTQIDLERAKWTDPTYIRSQARGRLFYVMPGEIQVSVIDDVEIVEDSGEITSAELTTIERSWAHDLVSSLLIAGTTNASGEELAPGAAASK